MKKIFQPFGIISKQTFTIMVVAQVVIALVLWQAVPMD